MPEITDSGVAILGSGIFARGAHLPALKTLGPLAPNLKAIYSRSEKSASELADQALDLLHYRPAIYHDDDPSANLDVLLARADISTVIVVLPIVVLPSIVLKVLAAGKHVISEKPVAPDVASGLKLIATYEAEYKPKGLVWRVAENHEAEPGHTIASEAIRAGKIGKVAFFSLRSVRYIDKKSKYRTPWRTHPEYQGGWLLDIGVHSAAALRAILPSPLRYLSGFTSLNIDWLAPQDTISAVVKAADGSHGTFEWSVAVPTESCASVCDSGIVVTGTNGYLTVDRARIKDPITGNEQFIVRIVIRSVTRDADGNASPEEVQVIDELVSGVEVELASFFAAALEGRDDGMGSPRGALRDVAVIEAALTSGGNLIDLEKLASPT